MNWDAVVIGSGFGGSVSALRLAEKGYRVLVLEKGRRFGPDDFPHSNRDLRRWMWAPSLGCRGPFRMTFLPHITALSGVGVGGGSLVYANTLPMPSDSFFQAPSWAHLGDWKAELAPHYRTAQAMLGANSNRLPADADHALQRVAAAAGRPDDFHMNPVGVYFGQPGVTVPDPYFDGRGPTRTGCIGCGGCMLGCRYNSKNTLDKNYLYLAEAAGVEIRPNTEVTWIEPVEGGYRVTTKEETFQAPRVFLAGGVLGTVPLLLRLQEAQHGLPGLSPRLGDYVRTNSEALIGVVSRRKDVDFSKGVAIGSIFKTDEHSHLEPCRYPAGSDFFRFLVAPHVSGDTALARLSHLLRVVLSHPLDFLRVFFGSRYAERSTILLYMRSMEGHLRLRLGRSPWTAFQRGLCTAPGKGRRPPTTSPRPPSWPENTARRSTGSL